MNSFITTSNSKKRIIKIFNTSKVVIDEEELKFDLSKINDHLYLIKLGNKVFEVTTQKLNNEKYSFLIDGHYFETTVRTNLKEKAVEYLQNKKSENHYDEVIAPMPGMIVKYHKNVGDKVELGESLLILEAMKMENDIRSPATGIIKEIFFNVGASLEKGAKILVIS